MIIETKYNINDTVYLVLNVRNKWTYKGPMKVIGIIVKNGLFGDYIKYNLMLNVSDRLYASPVYNEIDIFPNYSQASREVIERIREEKFIKEMEGEE